MSEAEQAPNIDPGPHQGRLVYDKKRRTITSQGKQAEIHHPLARFGYRRPPHWLWQRLPRTYVFVAAVKDIWLIATGRCTLHRAWQAGHDDGHLQEIERTLRGGR